jgi:virulence factor Mce-like protein
MRRVVLGILSLALLAALSACGPLSSGSMTVTAMLRDSAGLFVGNDVGVLGVPVGKVTAIKPDGDHVAVTLDITDSDVRIPASAGAAVVARSVATDRYVELTPVYRSGPTMRDGATIPVSRTVTPVDFDQVLGSVKRFSDGLVRNPRTTNSIRQLVSVSARTFRGHGAELNDTVTSLARAVSAVNGQRSNIFGTLRSLDTLTRALARNAGTLEAFVANVADASELLAAERHNIGRALTTMSAAVDAVAAFTREHRAAIKRNIEGTTTVMRNVLASRRDLQEILEVLPLATWNVALASAPDGNLRVRADATDVIPLGSDKVDQICKALGTVCDGLTFPPNAQQLIDGIFGRTG